MEEGHEKYMQPLIIVFKIRKHFVYAHWAITITFHILFICQLSLLLKTVNVK